MAIRNRISEILGKRRINIREFATGAGLTYATAHELYHEQGKGIYYEVMDKVCAYLELQPGDLFEYVPGVAQSEVATPKPKPKRGRPFANPAPKEENEKSPV